MIYLNLFVGLQDDEASSSFLCAAHRVWKG